MIQRVGDSADNIIASAGEDLEMECIATGGNPSPTLRWYADDQEIRSGHTQVLMFDCLIQGMGPIFLRRFRLYVLSFMFRFMLANICFEKNENSKIYVMLIINITGNET